MYFCGHLNGVDFAVAFFCSRSETMELSA